MKKIKVTLKDREKKLLSEMFNGSENANYKLNQMKRSQRLKAEVLWLRYQNKTNSEIVNKTGLCKRTVINYINNFRNYNLINDFICSNKYKKSSLDGVKNLLDEFRNNQPNSYREASERIKTKFNIKYIGFY